ncbi:MAG TPA: hypothetical protein VHC69_25705 [Polyangiaceae bacterium]|nr:hypothetical protein [Polyangiaceae bacterium]
MPKGRAPMRVLLALCISALLLGDVFRGFHLLRVRHVLCVEHGELVDADNGTGTARSTSGRTEALPSGSDAHHHDHCGIAATPSRTSHLAIATAAPSICAIAGLYSVPKVSVHAAQSRTVLSYAPKQSPPA